MWVGSSGTNTLRTLANEDLGTLAENCPLTQTMDLVSIDTDDEDAASAIVNEYVASAPVTSLLEPPILVVHTAQFHQVQVVQKTIETPALVKYVAPTPAVTFNEPVPVIEHAMPAPVFIYKAPSPTTPAPTDIYAARAPVIEHVGPALVTGYIAPVPPVTISTPSQQFPAYTMAAVTTGVNLDTTSLEQIVAEQERVQWCMYRYFKSRSSLWKAFKEISGERLP